MSSGFSRPTLPDLITTIRNDLYARRAVDDELISLRRNDPEVYGRVIAGATHVLLGYIENMAKNILPDQADEAWLIRHGNMKRCYRKQPTRAVGYIRFDAVADGIVIPKDRKVRRQADRHTYTVTQTTTSSNNILRVPVICDEVGTIGNCDDGSKMSLITPVTGLSSTCFADSIESGADIEDLESFRKRVIDRWYYTPQSGADQDYVQWAKEVPSVTRAWCYRHWAGTGSVGVMVANSDPVNPVLDNTAIQNIKKHIEPLAPVAGSMLIVFSPMPKPINFKIMVTPDNPEIRYQIETELKSFLLREGNPQTTLFRSRISEVISASFGEYAHELVYPDKDIFIEKNQVATFGGIEWI
ncbi:baseplate J/gp47 family protein [Gilliamella sp. Fer4-1]|uniref:baseplate J/gp47 family protein n=1 Tax=Gilliamella sp. Fer4-1 TaxID=3120242 RepID=UPI00080E0342|nr:baseplate J/gp47 family protein [Gilliamella apicola]OCG64027.1 phage baseplate protein [Gilliamella apicola]